MLGVLDLVTSHARGAGGSPLAETVLCKILAPEHRGLSSGKSFHERDWWQKAR